MKYWAFALTVLAAVPANAYPNTDPSEALRRLERRQDSCPSTNPVSCSAVDSKLPSNFCCGPSDGEETACLSLDESSSAICCPKGQTCNAIGTIECDVGLMDASKNSGPFFTTRLNDKLPTCGDLCCPFGYACANQNGQNVCILDQSRAGPATTTKVTSTTSATMTSTSTSTSSASSIDSINPPPKKDASNFSAGVFCAGFFPGIVVGVLATLAWVVFTKRHNKAPNTRGLHMEGNGARPYISNPIKDSRHSNQRSDFLSRTRSRAKSMFSTHRRSRTVDSTDFWNAKMPTPPANTNVPINYVNDMPNVPVTPARRVARYSSNENFSRAMSEYEKEEFSPMSPPSAVSDPNRPETIRIYSPDLAQEQQDNAPPVPAMPLAAIPPLRGMNTQRRISPPYGAAEPQRPRRDSGTAMDGFGSPFRTPEKRPEIQRNNTPSLHATYHDAATLDSPDDQREQIPQMLTPLRYDPNPTRLAPSKAALAAASRLSKAQQGLPSQQRNPKQSQAQPTVPARPQNKPSRPPRPETQISDFDFDAGLNHDHDRLEPPSPTDHPTSPPREAYKSQALANPYAPAPPPPRADPGSTFDNMLPGSQSQSQSQPQFEAGGNGKKDKHATNATTFTTMLNTIGWPDPGDQLSKVPAVPRVDMAKVGGKAKGKKGMI
ncbi:hypothetical protein LTR70_009264 [Exophiala xenobiotica]|uniref:Uncharacterized protein n=1 Tax=Lithohypha guttulata TaxID=1690604 RepID=A0ABR0JYE3_9EURO|nr:hypothetical protein LTR24_009076 [Lithohypha guttulata]KAK5310729.1 hypothetical protein LTR70_009264 [Exophiala xenobiotica]